MARVVMETKVAYTGGDIVGELINSNRVRYPGTKFLHLDLITGPIPRDFDLIFCRDCLVHLSYQHALAALETVKRAGSPFFMATTFPGRRNRDITTGQWRPVNLQAAPFSFPEPLMLVNEQCTEDDGEFADKSMGLWKLA